MATASKTWAFLSTAESWLWTLVSGSGVTAAWTNADGNPAGCLEARITGKNLTGVGYWEITGTWEALFGVPTNTKVKTVGTPCDYEWKCSEYTTGASGNLTGAFELRDSAGTLIGTFSAALGFSATSAWANLAGAAVAVPSNQQASNTTIKLRLNCTLKTGNSSSAAVTLRHDNCAFTITYETAVSNASLSREEIVAAPAQTALARQEIIASATSAKASIEESLTSVKQQA